MLPAVDRRASPDATCVGPRAGGGRHQRTSAPNPALFKCCGFQKFCQGPFRKICQGPRWEPGTCFGRLRRAGSEGKDGPGAEAPRVPNAPGAGQSPRSVAAAASVSIDTVGRVEHEVAVVDVDDVAAHRARGIGRPSAVARSGRSSRSCLRGSRPGAPVAYGRVSLQPRGRLDPFSSHGEIDAKLDTCLRTGSAVRGAPRGCLGRPALCVPTRPASVGASRRLARIGAPVPLPRYIADGATIPVPSMA
jgi:hypothetical protein